MGHVEEARRFVEEELQFQLGFLVTESSHPKTRTLSETFARSTGDGIRMLLSVDQDIVESSASFFGAAGFAALTDAFRRSALAGGMIVFSGCGSTGRLAVLLESIWRRFWIEAGRTASDRFSGVAERVRGIITGGDRALIRSVESFEDYEEFGREQVRELGLGTGDLFVAISEGGETSSVIGSAKQAIEDGCAVFFIYNNPTEILVSRIARSREIITHPGVMAIDLTTGPMALSGSTRMQATTAELFYVAAAMENAACAVMGIEARKPDEWCSGFKTLLGSLASDGNVETLAGLVETEETVYRAGRMVAYAADRYLPDVFADTTERTPTFSIPPFKRVNDPPDAANPWAVAFYPGLRSREAWSAMLGRPPIGLDWNGETYARLGVPRLSGNPPVLDDSEIGRYPVGDEVLDLYRGDIDLVVEILMGGFGDPISQEERPETGGGARRYGTLDSVSLYIGSNGSGAAVREVRPGTPDDVHRVRHIDLPLPRTAMDVFHHIAVKLVFNTLSTATMARMGRVRGNWMVQVSPTNKKLIDRSIRIISDLTEIDYRSAAEVFFETIGKKREGTQSAVQEILARLDHR